MLTTSSAFKTAVNASSRQIKARAAVAYTIPFMGKIVSSVTSSAGTSLSDPSKVVNGIGYGDYYNNGNYYGFLSSNACDSSGIFASSPTITVNFSYGQTIDHVEIVGDVKTGEYMTYGSVTFYNYLGNLLGTKYISGDGALKKILTGFSYTGCYKMVLTIGMWSKGSTIAKISSFTTRITSNYGADEIKSINIHEEMETDQGVFVGSVIAKQLEMVLFNFDGSFDSNTNLNINRKISIEFGVVLADGSTEWIPMGMFYSHEWKFSDDRQFVTVTAYDILSLLDDKIYSDTIASYPANSTVIITNILSKINSDLVESSQFFPTARQIASRPTWGKITCREALSFLMTGSFTDNGDGVQPSVPFIITEKTGEVQSSGFHYYSGFEVVKTITGDMYYKIVLDKAIYTSINTYTVQNAAGTEYSAANSIEVAASGVNELYISDNPCITNLTESTSIAKALKAFYELFSKKKITLEWQGDPSLELNDIINLRNADNTGGWSCVLIGNSYTYDGGLRTESRFRSAD